MTEDMLKDYEDWLSRDDSIENLSFEEYVYQKNNHIPD